MPHPAPPAASPHGPAAHAPHLSTTLRDYLGRYRAEMDLRVKNGEPGLALGRAYASAIDGLLSALLPATRATLQPVGRWVDCTLVAVGSYGRNELAPRSDLDVRIVVDQTGGAVDVAEALLYPLWDAGLQVGHQVIDIDGVLELAREDLSTATALLDFRFISGDRNRFDTLVRRAFDGFFTAELGGFINRLREERAQRHERFGGSLFLLEPDVKSGAGGLRDVDLARWAARARFHVSEIDELVRLGVLVPREAKELTAGQEFLQTVRAHLHVRAGRRSDRLTFDAQEELGRLLGDAPAAENEAIAAERFMQRYYGHAGTISRLSERVLDLCDSPRSRLRISSSERSIAPGVRTFGGHATLEQPTDLMTDPPLAMRLYHAAMRREMPVYPYARDAVARAAADPDWCARLRAAPDAAAQFIECLTTAADRTLAVATGTPKRGSILRELHDVGLLLAMVPEFHPVVGRVHHDTYHVYTVDVHSVAAVDRLRSLARGDLAAEYPLACRLAGDVPRPVPVYVATLLHDVGKGGGGSGHSARGAEQSVAICERLGLDAEEAAEVQWLILEHLTMYHRATRRDLDDPATVAQFATMIAESGGSPIERLQNLYLLTVADISTTSPTAMTAWKARMLDDLFLSTSHHLASASRNEETTDATLGRIRGEAQAAWPGGPDDPFLQSFLEGMPKSYLIAQRRGEWVTEHAMVSKRRGRLQALIELIPSRHAGALELCVVAADRPGLLASIAAALAANRLEVLTAQIFVRPIAEHVIEAVDLFSVRRSGQDGEEAIEPLTARELTRVNEDMERLVTGAIKPASLLRERRGAGPSWREKPAPAVETRVEIDDRASRRFTVVDVYAKDRAGLLFTLAHALHELGLSIARSKIATEGASAADSFYVTEIDGSKVASPARREEIKREIGAAMERLAREGIAS